MLIARIGSPVVVPVGNPVLNKDQLLPASYDLYIVEGPVLPGKINDEPA